MQEMSEFFYKLLQIRREGTRESGDSRPLRSSGRLPGREKGNNPTQGSSTDGHRQSDRAELFTRTGGGEKGQWYCPEMDEAGKGKRGASSEAPLWLIRQVWRMRFAAEGY